MHRAIATIPALIVTLALFFLMQLLISGGERDVLTPEVGGGVGLVTLLRDSVSGGGQGTQRTPVPPMPAPPSAPPAPPPATSAQIATPLQPDLTTDISEPEPPVIEALPFLGGPPVVAAKKPVAPIKPKAVKSKVAKNRSAKEKSSKHATAAQAKAKSSRRGKAAQASAGSKASGAGRGAGGKRGKGRSGRGAKSKGDSGVVVLSRPKPAYPRKALRNKKEGWVKVSFTVTEKGTVANPKVVASKPRRVFDRSALQAIKKWRFKPKTVGGRPVRAKATQLIEFKLARR